MAWQEEYRAATIAPATPPPAPPFIPSAAPGGVGAFAAGPPSPAGVFLSTYCPILYPYRAVPPFIIPIVPVLPPFPVGTLWRDYLAEARGLYRIFNDAEYRFYRSDAAPPAEGSEPFATNATLPHTPADVYADGTWYLACSYCNGVLDSGFLPIGPNGETYLRIDLAAGDEIQSPPNAPNHWRLIQRGGVVYVQAAYYQVGDLRADQWAIAYTTDEGVPATDDPDLTKAMPGTGLCLLRYALPAQDHDTVVKVRLQTRRQDGETWYYSEGSAVETITVDTEGPTAPLAGMVYPGVLPEGG